MAANQATKSTARVLRTSPNCCYAGNQHEGTPAYPDIDLTLTTPVRKAYLSHARQPHIQEGKGLLLIPDANGLWHNSRLLADQFAAAGYVTLVCPYNGVVRAEDKTPDEATRDTTLNIGDDAQKKAYKAAIDSGYSYLRRIGCDTVGIISYSEGARAVIDTLKERNIAACFLATPILDTWTDLSEIKTPVSVALADESDMDYGNDPQDHMSIEKELMNSSFPYQLSIYSHVHLGFAQRRRLQSKAEVFAKKQAFIQAITWMQEHMLNGK